MGLHLKGMTFTQDFGLDFESTDEHFYEIDLFNYHWPLYGLGLGDKILKRVYRRNALKALYPGPR